MGRAILLVVGGVVLVTVLLGLCHRPRWLWLTGLLGPHLIQASRTGICPVVTTLKKPGMPSRAGFA